MSRKRRLWISGTENEELTFDKKYCLIFNNSTSYAEYHWDSPEFVDFDHFPLLFLLPWNSSSSGYVKIVLQTPPLAFHQQSGLMLQSHSRKSDKDAEGRTHSHQTGFVSVFTEEQSLKASNPPRPPRITVSAKKIFMLMF